MSDVRNVIAVAVCAALAVAAPAAAQDPAALRDQLERLRREQATALAAARQSDRERLAGVLVDTVRAGVLTVLVPHAISSLARAATAEAWRTLHARFGDAVGAIAGTEFILQQAGAPDIVPRAPNDRVRSYVVNPQTTTDVLARWLAIHGASDISIRQDVALRGWIGTTVSAFSDSTDRDAGVYVELATRPWTAVKRCYVGDLDGCRHALGLVPAMDLIDQWYDAEDQRRMIATLWDNRSGNRWSGTPAERDACVDGGDVGGCRALLRRLSPVEPPLPSGPRALVGLALDLGGPGAYDRLVASPDRPIADRLEAAAGVSDDSLIATGRARALVARPQPVTLNTAGAWAAFAWVLVLAATALRSTRWR